MESIGFEAALEIIAEHCMSIDKKLAKATNDIHREQLRRYGCDIWVADLVHKAHSSHLNQIEDKEFAPFYEAAWELCRMGVLRPGPFAPKGMGSVGGGVLHTDGYSITEIGRIWLHDPERRQIGDPGRMSTILAGFAQVYGDGFAQRSIEAVRCHRTGSYLASCAMAGAAAESILLSVAIARTADEDKVVAEYSRSGGRQKAINIVTQGHPTSLRGPFEAGMALLSYWRDNAAHGKATTISEVEAFTALALLLRLAHFCNDNWRELTT